MRRGGCFSGQVCSWIVIEKAQKRLNHVATRQFSQVLLVGQCWAAAPQLPVSLRQNKFVMREDQSRDKNLKEGEGRRVSATVRGEPSHSSADSTINKMLCAAHPAHPHPCCVAQETIQCEQSYEWKAQSCSRKLFLWRSCVVPGFVEHLAPPILRAGYRRHLTCSVILR